MAVEVEELVEDQSIDQTLSTDNAYYRVDGMPNQYYGYPTDYVASRTFRVNGVDNPYQAMNATDAVSGLQVPAIGDLYTEPMIGSPTMETPLIEGLNMRATNINIENVENIDTSFDVVVTYNSRRKNKDESFKFTNTGDTVEVNFCESQQKFGTNAKDLDNTVGLASDGVISGVSIQDSTQELLVTKWRTTTEVTALYLASIDALKNTTNDTAFYGKAIGEILFLGMDIVEQDNFVTKMEFRFMYNPNTPYADLPPFKQKDDSAIDFSTITGANKLGWEYLWVQTAEKEKGTATVSYTQGAYVSKMYNVGTYSALELFGEYYPA